MASPGVTSDVESPPSPLQFAGVTAEAYFEQSVDEISFDLDHPDHVFPGNRYRFADGSEPKRVGGLFQRQGAPTAASKTGQFWIPPMAFAVWVHSIAEEGIEYARFNSDPVTKGQTALVSVPSYNRYFLCGFCTAGFLLGSGVSTVAILSYLLQLDTCGAQTHQLRVISKFAPDPIGGPAKPEDFHLLGTYYCKTTLLCLAQQPQLPMEQLQFLVT